MSGDEKMEKDKLVGNESLFDEVEVRDNEDQSIEAPKPIVSNQPPLVPPKFSEISDDIVEELVVELAEEDVGKVFTIESVEILEPKTIDDDGNVIPPQPFNKKPDSKIGYQSKLKITYKDSKYVSLLPNIKWYKRVDKQTQEERYVPWFNINNLDDNSLNDQFTAQTSKLYYKFCVKFGMTPGKVPRLTFIKELVGKNVKLSQYKTKYEGSMRYRIDIEEFV